VIVQQPNYSERFSQEDSLPPAGLGWRIFAALWDFIIVGAIWWIVLELFKGLFLELVKGVFIPEKTNPLELFDLTLLVQATKTILTKLADHPGGLGIVFGVALLLPPIVNLLYYALWEMLVGATPGKLLMGLRVTRYNGKLLDLGDAIKRNFFKNLLGNATPLLFAVLIPIVMNIPFALFLMPFVLATALIGTLIFSLIDLMAIAFHEDGQALHDQYSSSIVTRTQQTPPMQRPILALASLFLLIPGAFIISTTSPSSPQKYSSENLRLSTTVSTYSTLSKQTLPPTSTSSPIPSKRARFDFNRYRHEIYVFPSAEDSTEKSSAEADIIYSPQISKVPTSEVIVGERSVKLRDQVAMLSGDKSIIEVAFYTQRISRADKQQMLSSKDIWKNRDHKPVVVIGLRFSPFSDSCGMLSLRKIFLQFDPKLLEPGTTNHKFLTTTLNPGLESTSRLFDIRCERSARTPIVGKYQHKIVLQGNTLDLDFKIDTTLR
jgi:uncharacterized RDD family membrane protein YckC